MKRRLTDARQALETVKSPGHLPVEAVQQLLRQRDQIFGLCGRQTDGSVISTIVKGQQVHVMSTYKFYHRELRENSATADRNATEANY